MPIMNYNSKIIKNKVSTAEVFILGNNLNDLKVKTLVDHYNCFGYYYV